MDALELERYGYPLLKRKEEIMQKMKNPEMFFPIEYMGKQAKLKCISVRIELPVYRLANGRTRSLQLEYLSQNPEVSRELFTNDHDAFAAQYAQHELLKKLAKDEDLLDAFKSEKKEQTEPIICTDTGVVVNGNRRLCVWRELYYGDKNKYKSFETISIAILENYDEKAIADIEKRLQIQKTMRAEYHWHTKALMAKEDLERGYKEGEVAKSYELSIKQVKTLIEAREFAEQYLINKGYRDHWSRVDKKYYAFESIVTGRRKIVNQNERELFEKLAFDLIGESADELADKPSGRLYTTIKDYADNIHALAIELYAKYTPENPPLNSKVEDNTIPVEQIYNDEPADNNHSDERINSNNVSILYKDQSQSNIRKQPELLIHNNHDDDIVLLAGGEPVEVDKASVVSEVINIGADTSDIHSAIKNIIETQKTLQSEKDKATFLLHTLSKISGELQSAISYGLVDNVILHGVEQQLNCIREKVGYIQTWIDGKK